MQYQHQRKFASGNLPAEICQYQRKFAVAGVGDSGGFHIARVQDSWGFDVAGVRNRRGFDVAGFEIAGDLT